MAIWVTLSMHPHPASESQQVEGSTFWMWLRQVKRMYYSWSGSFLEEKKSKREASILLIINFSALLIYQPNPDDRVAPILLRVSIFHQLNLFYRMQPNPPKVRSQPTINPRTYYVRSLLYLFRKPTRISHNLSHLAVIPESMQEDGEWSEGRKDMGSDEYEQTVMEEEKCCWKYVRCCLRLWEQLWNSHNKGWSIHLEEGAEAEIGKIKRMVSRQRKVLPELGGSKKRLILDFEGVLIFTTFSKPQRYDYEVEVRQYDMQLVMQGRRVRCYCVVRFGVEYFLDWVSERFEIVVYTASNRLLIEQIIRKMGVEKYISHMVHRDKCVKVGRRYLKSLHWLGGDNSNTIMIDSDRSSRVLQEEHCYEVQPFKGEGRDRLLIRLRQFLDYLSSKQRIYPFKAHLLDFTMRQIDVFDGKDDATLSTLSTVSELESTEIRQRQQVGQTSVANLMRHA